MVWIPTNPHMAELGIDDSEQDLAVTYLQSLSHGLIDEKLAAVYIDTGPEMVTWLEANTPVIFQIVKGFPDYHPEHPGAKPGGGGTGVPAVCFDQLGDWAHRVTVGPQSGATSMSETSMARKAPGGVAAEEWHAGRSATNGARARHCWGGC